MGEPMTPRRAIVPVEPDDQTVRQVVAAMAQALASPARIKDGPVDMIGSMRHVAQAGADALLAASPSSGRISAANLERAAEAARGQREYDYQLQGFTYDFGSVIRDLHLAPGEQELGRFSDSREMTHALAAMKDSRAMRAALTALGLAVEGEAPASAGAGKLKGTRG